MASSYTVLGTEKMGIGANAGNWGTKTNTNLVILEQALGGYLAKSIAGSAQTTTLAITDGDSTASTSEARHHVIKLTGTITGNQTVTVPADIVKSYIVSNATSGAYTVLFKAASASGFTFAATNKGVKFLYADGTNVVDTGIGSVGTYDLDGGELTLDADSDTSITADTDDQIDIEVGGTDRVRITTTALAPSSSDGAALGTSALEWADLFLADSAVLNFGDDQDTTLTHTDGTGLTLNSTNKLCFYDTALYIHSSTDGQLDLVADTEIQIAATTIDINGAVALNGAITGATDITLSGELDAATLDISGNADIDGTLEADAITINSTAIGSIYGVIAGSSSIVTTGALDSGSITSGFGAIDTGSSTITTTGLISGGSLDIDNVLINGTTIGHTDDTDLLTVADGLLTVAGEISVTTLDIGGTNVTTTAAELNLIDGGASTGTTAVADADGILTNDDGTMRLTTAATFKTYFQSGVTASSIAADDIAAGDAAVTIGNGSTSADVTIDSGDDVVIDAAGGNIEFKDAGTTQLTLDMDGTGGAQVIQLRVDTDDLIFKQFDGTTVLTLDDDTTVKVATDLTVGDDLTLLSDSAVLGFGADTDTTLTHTDGTGLTLNSTNKLCFNDASQFVQGSSATVLSIGATNEIDLTATAIDINGTCDISGTFSLAGTNVTSTATELNKLDGVGTLKQAGKESIWVPANAMTPTESNGCADIAKVETTSGRPDLNVLDFDASSDEHAQFAIAFPKQWNLGTITFQCFWTSTATDTDGVSFGLQGVAMNDNETQDVAYGSAVVVDDACQGAAEELYVTAESGAVTIAGTPADNDLTYFRIFRDVSDANDTAAEDARLLGVKLIFTTDAANDD